MKKKSNKHIKYAPLDTKVIDKNSTYSSEESNKLINSGGKVAENRLNNLRIKKL